MELFEEFCNQIGVHCTNHDVDIDCILDSTNYNVIDGEEGDYGVIRYYTLDGNLIATYTNCGGDLDYVEFTEFGKKLFTPLVMSVIELQLNKIECNSDEVSNAIIAYNKDAYDKRVLPQMYFAKEYKLQSKTYNVGDACDMYNLSYEFLINLVIDKVVCVK